MHHNRLLLLLLTFVAAACAAPPPLTANDDAPALSEAIIAHVNTAASSWTAGWNSKFASMTVRQARQMLGVVPNSRRTRLPPKASAPAINPNDIPASFDARLQWPNCASISHVRDQGPCGSCWCVLPNACPPAHWPHPLPGRSVQRRRYPIASASAQAKQTKPKFPHRSPPPTHSPPPPKPCSASRVTFACLPHSSQDLVSCCDDCGAGCDGGDPSAAWDWWVSDGIVSETTCVCPTPTLTPLLCVKQCCCSYPYAFKTCEHHMNGTKATPPLPPLPSPSPPLTSPSPSPPSPPAAPPNPPPPATQPLTPPPASWERVRIT